FGVSAVRCSGVELVWAARTARVPDVSASRHAIARTGPPGRGRGRVCGMGSSSERTRGFLGTYGRGGDSQITAKRPRAFDATNVTRELWNSRQNLSRDGAGKYVKLAAPTIANGHDLPTFSNSVAVCGL